MNYLLTTRVKKLEALRLDQARRIFLLKAGGESIEGLLSGLSPEDRERGIVFSFDIGEDDMKKEIPNCLTLSKEELKARLDAEIRQTIAECKAEGVSDSVINQLVKAHSSNESKPAEHLPDPQADQEADPAEPGDEITMLLSRKKRESFRIDRG